MGLDGVELVMAIEEEFQIDLADEEIERCRMVYDLTDLVYDKVRDRNDVSDWQNEGLEKVRIILANSCAIPGSQVTPQTKLSDIIPINGRKEIWKKLQNSFKPAKLASLCRSRRCCRFIFLCVMCASISGVWCLGIIWALVVMITIWMLGVIITQPFRTAFPDNCETVDNLIYYSIKYDEKAGFNSRADVDWLVKGIIVDQLGVTTRQVMDRARFVEDLGIC